ncbi:hypothetical protein, partial [uncultured Oscillibacter sp.]|uniref:hypothetical protein n=1 Tax=uncultured Oscillibacter sp. TaxID=876091 RepID=UPI00262FB986
KYSVFKVPSTTPLLSHISTKNAKNQLFLAVAPAISVSLIRLTADGFFCPLYLTVTLQPPI